MGGTHIFELHTTAFSTLRDVNDFAILHRGLAHVYMIICDWQLGQSLLSIFII